MFFQSESYSCVDGATGICCGGFLRHDRYKKRLESTWKYKYVLTPATSTTYKLQFQSTNVAYWILPRLCVIHELRTRATWAFWGVVICHCHCMLTKLLLKRPSVLLLLSVQCNARHWTDIKSLECMSVCLCVCPKYLSFTIVSAVFVRSSSNAERRSHIWQQRPSSMANNTGSSKRTCASIYFRFSLLLGVCPG